MNKSRTSAIGKLEVQDELWRIFTFCTLNSDSTQPEHMKMSTFVKFAKDVQITSSRFTPTQIELELAHILRNLRKGEVKVGAASLSFTEFLATLDVLASKVYPNNPPDVACRRLLLENVLLLGGRRNESYGLDITNPQAMEIIHGELEKGLENIFKHYLELAEQHRTSKRSKEVATNDISRKQLREHLKEMKDKIIFHDFMQFCLDYNLKSASFLTGMHVGHVYLTTVQLDDESKTTKGMTFDMFCQCLLHLALLAFRHVPGSQMNIVMKTKALFLSMWKSVNKPENIMRAKANAPAWQQVTQGDLHGSAIFSESFLKIWQNDGFVDYENGPDEKQVSGVNVVEKLAEVTANDPALHEVLREREEILAAATNNNNNTSPQGRVVSHAGAKVLEHLGAATNQDIFNSTSNNIENENEIDKVPESITIKGSELIELLRQQPELMELMLLELENK